MTGDDRGLLEQLAACEERVWDALVRGDRAADAAALDEDFLGVYATGFAGRDEHAGQLAAGPTVESYTLSDLRLLHLGPDHVLLAYRATYGRPGRSASDAMYVSSVWRRREGGWVNVFSQDTPAAD